MSTELLDAPAGVRSGEELNVVALEKYRKAQLPDLRGKLTIEQFPGGHSNLTYCLQLSETQLCYGVLPSGSRLKASMLWGANIAYSRAYTRYIPRRLRPRCIVKTNLLSAHRFM